MDRTKREKHAEEQTIATLKNVGKMTAKVVQEVFGTEVVALELVDPRFYQIDMALCSLSRGEIMDVPEALTLEGRAAIDDLVESAQQIEVERDEACRLAANAVCIGSTLIVSACGGRLRPQLQ